MNPFQRIPIFHMASLARSGETLVQKYLSAHSKIHICHNLYKDDSPKEIALFEHLMTRKSRSIGVRHPMARHLKSKKGDALVIKQGVWNHPHPFNGFVLARNPLSVFASLWTYDIKERGGSPELNWVYNIERMKRWLGKMDEACSAMGLAYESQMADAHLMFKDRKEGHGGTDLSRPLDNRSLGKYQDVLSEEQVRLVAAETGQTASKMGYSLDA